MRSNISSNFSEESGVEICLWTYYLHSPSSSYMANMTAVGVVNALFSIAGIILNSLVLYTFWKTPRMRSKMSSFTIMVLSSIDFAVVTIVQPLFLFVCFNQILRTSKCVYEIPLYLAGFLFCGMSASTLFTINIERCFSIVRPILHRTMVTKQRFVLACGLFWLITSFTLVIASYALPFVGLFVISIFLFLVCSTSFFLYNYIFRIARKRLCNVNKPDKMDHGDASHVLTSFLRQLKMAKTYVLIVSLAFICYLPLCGIAGYDIIGGSSKPIARYEKGIEAWALTLLFANSTLNSLVFFWMNRELRKECFKIIKIGSVDGR